MKRLVAALILSAPFSTWANRDVENIGRALANDSSVSTATQLAAAIVLIDDFKQDYHILDPSIGPDDYAALNAEVRNLTGVHALLDPFRLRFALGMVFDTPEPDPRYEFGPRVHAFVGRVLEIWVQHGYPELGIAHQRRSLRRELMTAHILAEVTRERPWSAIERHAFGLEVRAFFESIVRNREPTFIETVADFRDSIWREMPAVARAAAIDDLALLAQGHALTGESRAKLKMALSRGVRLNLGEDRSAFIHALKIMRRAPGGRNTILERCQVHLAKLPKLPRRLKLPKVPRISRGS